MKVITNFVYWLCFAILLSSCNNSSSKSEGSKEKSNMLTETFDAEFIGDYDYTGPDTLMPKKCSDSLAIWRAIVNCQGTSDFMGEIKVHFDFCGYENGNYGNTYSYFLDNSKDTLFVSCEGTVIAGRLEEHPSFVTSYWKDDFVILGGTGKFEGATGNGKTDDYNSSEDPNSHHHWIGTITYKKEHN